MRRLLFAAAAVPALLAIGLLFLPFLPASPLGAGGLEVFGSREISEYLFRRGVEETGAINLVSAVYLGYRAFDTLGETIILVLSVAGVLAVLGGKT